MLAELRGKIDPEGQDGGVARSEDLLTEAVFGSVRYPRRLVLGPLLTKLSIEAKAADIANAKVLFWPTYPRPDWPGQRIEPDVVVLVGKQPVVFEAKLYSGFGHYLTTPDGGQFIHQLAAQYQAVASWAKGEQMRSPIVVAVSRGPESPDSDLEKARNDLLDVATDPQVAIKWISWRDIARLLEKATGLQRHELDQRDDVLALGAKRNETRMFNGLRPEDYYLLTAAQRVAADSLYPDIRTFFDDLTSVLQIDDVRRVQPSRNAMWLSSGRVSESRATGAVPISVASTGRRMDRREPGFIANSVFTACLTS
jgi:hypothetical protein